MFSYRTIALSLFALFLVGCNELPLFSNVEESEANEMMALLLRAGVVANKVPGEEETWTLQVEKPDFERSVKLLTELGFPRRSYKGVGDSFQKSGLVSSPAEERIRFVHALSEDLAETLSEMDGVMSARVHIVVPGNDPYGKDVKPSSAAVFLKHHSLIDLEDSAMPVKELVANSVEGLTAELVSVVMIPSEPTETLLPPQDEATLNEVILGVSVPRNSVQDFWTILGGLGAVVVILLAVVGFLFVRLRSVRTKPAS